LAEFKSEKFSDKRNMVNRFYSRHPNHRVEELDLSEKKNADQVRKVLQKWENKLGMDAHEIIVEFTAIEKAIIHSKELGIRCFATYVDDEIEAFTIFEHLDERNVVMHFEKANRKISGIYEHQKHNLAKHLHAQGIETINYGQDLGYEGLRKSKMSYHPVRFHKKYSLKHKKAQNFTPKHQPNKRTSSHAKHANTVHHSPHKTHTTA
jgi:hypothetical protein